MPHLQSYNFHARLRGCFRATAASGAGANDADLEKAIKKAEFVKSEVEALIFLKKYRQSEASCLPLDVRDSSSCPRRRPLPARRSCGRCLSGTPRERIAAHIPASMSFRFAVRERYGAGFQRQE